MGRYSRKDMIEFANFAKSYQSSKKVDEAYAAYLKGARLVTRYDFGNSLYTTIMKANLVFVDDMCVKGRVTNYVVNEFDFNNLNLLAIESWNNDLKVLRLKTIE